VRDCCSNARTDRQGRVRIFQGHIGTVGDENLPKRQLTRNAVGDNVRLDIGALAISRRLFLPISDPSGGFTHLVIGHRLRQLRKQKALSQGDIEKRTGLLRSYVSRVENGHTVPSVENLEKFALALEVPMYQLFYDNETTHKLAKSAKRVTTSGSVTEANLLIMFRRFFSHMEERDRQIFLLAARKLSCAARRRYPRIV
jgi:transcriptional regulator with XRE-family HTH domain